MIRKGKEDQMKRRASIPGLCAAGVLLTVSTLAFAPAPAAPQPGRGPQAPAVLSPEVTADRHVSFRLYAPQAQAVRLSAGDIISLTPAASALTKAENGVWSVTVGPVDP